MPKGVSRRFDNLGRLVIPKEIRRSMDWLGTTLVDIYMDADKVILQTNHEEKLNPKTCKICTSDKNLYSYHGMYICKQCFDDIAKAKPLLTKEQKENSKK